MKTGAKLAVMLFVLVALAHLGRLILGTEVTVDGNSIPQWVSIVGFVVPAGISLMLWRESH